MGHLLGALVCFAALAGGAHDLWAATIVYSSVVLLTAAVIVRRSWPVEGAGISVDFWIPLLAVFLAFSLSYRQSVNPSESRMALMDWTSALLLFILAQNIFKSDSSAARFFAVLVPVLWIQFGTVLLQASNPDLNRLKEATGTMNNANIQTAFFLAWVPILTSRALDDKAKRLYWISGLSAAAAGILILSSSTGLLCLGLGVLLSLRSAPGRFSVKRNAQWIALGIFLLACILAVLLWKKLGAQIMVAAGGVATYRPSARVGWWMSALHMWRENPWLGIGLGNFPSAYLAYKVGSSEHTLYAHGILMELLSETGIVGLAAVVFFVAMLAGRGWRSRGDISSRRPLLAGVLSLAIFSLISVSLEYLANLMAGALLTGMAFAPLARATVKPRRSILLVSCVAAIALMPYILSPFVASRQVVAASHERARGRENEAIRLAQGAAAMDPLSWEAHQELARAYASSDLENAVLQQRLAVSKNALSGALWWELGVYSLKAGKKAEALASFERAKSLNRASGPRE